MNQTWKWTAVAALAGAAIYLGTLVVHAQQAGKSDDTTAQKLEEITKKLDDMSKKLDDVTQRLDAVQKDIQFIKARGKG
jgi:peptidoglycan hydrolase CwlO-like protein